MEPGGQTVIAGGWINYQCEHQGVTSLHCVPSNDLKEHLLDPHTPCPCGAEEMVEAPDYFLHRAFDGREAYESPVPGKPPLRKKH